MKRALKTPFRLALQRLGLYPSYKLARDGYLRDIGWYESFTAQASIGRRRTPLPWLTYPAIELLSRRVRPEHAVFEYGAGMSTLWWAGRVRRVVSCEHDRSWYEWLESRVPEHVTLLHRELHYGGAYGNTILDYPGEFQVVVIDGRDRVHCARNAVKGLSPDGVIVWDDAERAQYREGIASLAEQGFRRVELVGMAPAACAAHETSIFYRDANCLGL